MSGGVPLPPLGRRGLLLVGGAAAALARPGAVRAQSAEAASGPPTVGIAPLGETVIQAQGGSGLLRLSVEMPRPPESLETAPPALLEAWGLPPRPQAGTPQRATWREALRELRFAVARPVPVPVGAAPSLGGPQPRPVAAGSWNWCGMHVRAPQPKRLVAVEGSWAIPDGSAGNAGSGARGSQWIGLDGLDPGSWSLPQMGTARRFRGPGQGETTLWWQWWIRNGEVQDGIDIRGLPLAPGDRVNLRVAALGPRRVRFHALVEPRAGGPATVVAFAVTLSVENARQAAAAAAAGTHARVPRSLGVEGRTAVWVVERPRRPLRLPGEPWLYTLPRSEPVRFSGCRAVLDDRSVLDLRRAGALRITDWSDRERPGRTVAYVADGPGAGGDAHSFEVRFGSPRDG